MKNLSSIRLAQGRVEEARELARGTLERFREAHDHNGIAAVLTDLGEEAMRRGDVVEALGHFDEMRREALRARNDNHRRTALTRIAACELMRGDAAAAHAVLDELSLSLSVEKSHWLAPTLQALRAWALAMAGRDDAARQALELVGGGPDDDALRTQALNEAQSLLGDSPER